MRDFFANTLDLLAGGGAAIAGFLHGMTSGQGRTALLLAALMGADYVSGVLAAALGRSRKTAHGRLSSQAGWKGLLRKAVILLVVGLSVLLDWYVGQGSAMFQTADGSSIKLVIYDNDGSLASDVTQDAIVSLLEGSLEQMGVEAQVLDPVFETGKLGGVCPYYRIDYTVVMGDVVMGQTMLGINADRAYTFTYTDMTGDWGQIFADAVASITPVAQ